MKKMTTQSAAKSARPAAKKISIPGKFVYKPIVNVISLCACGDKYVMTRKGQKTCIRCMFEN